MSKLPVGEAETRKGLSPTAEASLEVLRVIGPIIISAITAIWIAFQYFDAGQKDREQAEAQKVQQRALADKEITARIAEARKPFNELQLRTYQDVATVAGVLATAQQGEPAYTDAKREFYKLYWSRLSMVEDGKVAGSMVNLDRALRNYEANAGSLQSVQNRIYCLALALKGSIEQSWTISLPNVTNFPQIEASVRQKCDEAEELLEGATKMSRN